MKIIIRFLILLIIFQLSASVALAEGRYLSRFVTQDDTREHGGNDNVILIGSYVVWEGEDTSNDSQVYINKGSSINTEILRPDGFNFNKAFLMDANDDFIVVRAQVGSSYSHYLYDINLETTTEPAFEGVDANHTLSNSNIFYSVSDSGVHRMYKYDIGTGVNEEISISSGSQFQISELPRAHYEGRVFWREYDNSGSGDMEYYYYDGSTTVLVTNYPAPGSGFMGTGLNEDFLAFSDGSNVIATNFTDGSWQIYPVSDQLEVALTTNVVNNVSHGWANVLSDNGYVLQANFNWVDGSYMGYSEGGSADEQIYFLQGLTNLVLISDYRYDGGGAIKFESPWFDSGMPLHGITSETLGDYPSGSYLPHRWMRHDVAPSAGEGIIAYEAYSAYQHEGAYGHVNELMVYDIENEQHYGLFLDDSARAGHYTSMAWAECDPENKNVAFTIQSPWSTVDMDVCIAYWLGPEAYLVDVDLSGEDLSGVDFSNADLTNADFTGADLSGTDFSDATIAGTIFSNAIYDVSTVMPMSFVPGDYEMISMTTEDPTSIITELTLDSMSYSNSSPNLYVGIEYTENLYSNWHGVEAQGTLFFSTGVVGSVPIDLASINHPQLFFRTDVSTDLIGDWADYSNGIIQFVEHDYIDLEHIDWISRFRSGMGHDYTDDFETCSSMKHYYHPGISNWTDISIYSPVDGTILDVEYNENYNDMQVKIKSDAHPEYKFILFHVHLDPSLTNGVSVTAGQEIGNHSSTNTMSDIAVRISTLYSNQPMNRLVSYFDVMTDNLFSNYLDRGVIDKSNLIISYEERTNDMLVCEGETFVGPTGTMYFVDGGMGSISNRFNLNP